MFIYAIGISTRNMCAVRSHHEEYGLTIFWKKYELYSVYDGRQFAG